MPTLKYQQRLPEFEIALIVLRAFTNALEASLPLVPQLPETLEHIRPGEIVYLYADEALAHKDARKGPPKTE